MGFESVRSNKEDALPYKAASKMEKGEELVGYVIRIDEFEGKHGPQKSLILRDPDTSEDLRVYACGDLKYDINDGRVGVGYLTKITCGGKEDRKNKAGTTFTITKFEVAQDKENFLAELIPNVNTDIAAMKDRVQALKDKQVKK